MQGVTRVFSSGDWKKMKPYFDGMNSLRPGTYTDIVTFPVRPGLPLTQEGPWGTYVISPGELNGGLVGPIQIEPIEHFHP
jgi:hypothetical protein